MMDTWLPTASDRRGAAFFDLTESYSIKQLQKQLENMTKE